MADESLQVDTTKVFSIPTKQEISIPAFSFFSSANLEKAGFIFFSKLLDQYKRNLPKEIADIAYDSTLLDEESFELCIAIQRMPEDPEKVKFVPSFYLTGKNTTTYKAGKGANKTQFRQGNVTLYHSGNMEAYWNGDIDRERVNVGLVHLPKTARNMLAPNSKSTPLHSLISSETDGQRSHLWSLLRLEGKSVLTLHVFLGSDDLDGGPMGHYLATAPEQGLAGLINHYGDNQPDWLMLVGSLTKELPVQVSPGQKEYDRYKSKIDQRKHKINEEKTAFKAPLRDVTETSRLVNQLKEVLDGLKKGVRPLMQNCKTDFEMNETLHMLERTTVLRGGHFRMMDLKAIVEGIDNNATPDDQTASIRDAINLIQTKITQSSSQGSVLYSLSNTVDIFLAGAEILSWADSTVDIEELLTFE